MELRLYCTNTSILSNSYFLEFWVEMAKLCWRSRPMTPIFYTDWENLKMHIWCKFDTSCCTDKPNFIEFLLKLAKMALEVKVNDLHFQYWLAVSHDAYLVKIWWFQLKSMMIYCADNIKLTDGQADRHRQQQYPLDLKGQGVKIRLWTHKLPSIPHPYGREMEWFHDCLALPWRHYECDGISNHKPCDCLFSHLFRRRSKKISKLCVTGLCAGNSPVPHTKDQLRGKCLHLMASSWEKMTMV